MKKKILASLLTLVMLLGCVMTVSAAGSKHDPIEPVGPNSAYYITTVDAGNGINSYEELTDAAIDANDKIADKDAAKQIAREALDKIAAANALQAVSYSDSVDAVLAGKSLVQKFFDLDEVGDHSACHAQGYHQVTLELDQMTTRWTNIVLVHFSADRILWETIQPTVDYNAKTITFTIADLSPLAVYADVLPGGEGGSPSSPSTPGAPADTPTTGTGSEGTPSSPLTEGTSSLWMICTAVALVVVGATLVSQRKRVRK